MARKLNLHNIQKKQEAAKSTTPIMPKASGSKFLDTTHNTNYHVMKAFNSLPWVYDAQTEAIAYAIRTEKEGNDPAWVTESHNAQIRLQNVKKQSRIDNPHVLFDLLTDITKKVNTDPANARFITDFKDILRYHHKDIYKWVRDKLSPQQKDKLIFTTVMKVLWNRIATHEHADCDWLAALKILKECWLTKPEQFIREIAHKDSKRWYIQVDAGWANGISVENVFTNKLSHKSLRAYSVTLNNMLKQITVLLDHHNSQVVNGKISHWTSSIAYMVFKLLQSMDAIPADKYEQILRFVKFVDIVDHSAIEVIGKDFTNSHKTLIGLQKLILKDYKNIDFIYDQFAQKVEDWVVTKQPNTWLEVLSDEFLQNTQVYIDRELQPLKKLSESKKLANTKADELAEKLLDEWKTLYSHLNQESFIVDVDGKLLNAAEVANYKWTWVIKVLPDGKLFIYSPNYMKFDEKTWSTFGDYTRWHILFIDPSKISDWARFEKVLFSGEENKPMLTVLRNALSARKAGIKAKDMEGKQTWVVKSITHWAISKFVSSQAPLHVSDIKPWKEYDVVVNNIIDNMWVFVTFGRNADKSDIQWKDAYINWLIHKRKLTPMQLSYFKSVVQWEDVVRVVVTEVTQNQDHTYRIQVWPISNSKSYEEWEGIANIW